MPLNPVQVRMAVYTALPYLIPLYSQHPFSPRSTHEHPSATQQGSQALQSVNGLAGTADGSPQHAASSTIHADSSADGSDGIAAVAAASSSAAKGDNDKVRGIHAVDKLESISNLKCLEQQLVRGDHCVPADHRKLQWG